MTIVLQPLVSKKIDLFQEFYKVLKTFTAELEARVPGLSLGKKYQFRVVACTKVLELFNINCQIKSIQSIQQQQDYGI